MLTLENIKVANSVFSPGLGSIKGNTVQTNPSPVVQYYAAFSASIRQLLRQVGIVVDIMYVNSITFLVAVSKSLNYMTSMYIRSWKKTHLVSGLMKVIQLYAKYGFLVNFINRENKFETLRYDFPRVYFNIAAADEHVPEAG